MAHTPHEREATLRGLLKFQFGVADADSVANPLAAAAKAAGYQDEYDMALSALIRGGRADDERCGKTVAENARRRRAKAARPVVETAEDAKVPDDELLLVLSAMLEDEPAGVRGPDWFRELSKNFDELGGRMSMTKDGFYARIKKLVASGKVKAAEAKVPQKLYGREVMATVTLYSLPPEEAKPATKEGGVA